MFEEKTNGFGTLKTLRKVSEHEAKGYLGELAEKYRLNNTAGEIIRLVKGIIDDGL